nr:MAG TPA: SPHINGOSINE KINASE 1 [Bacteriophage sp.]
MPRDYVVVVKQFKGEWHRKTLIFFIINPHSGGDF